MDIESSRTNRLLEAIRLAQTEFILESSTRVAFRLLLDELLALTESEYGFIGEIETSDTGQALRVWAYTDISWNEETRQLLRDNAATGLVFDNMATLFGHAITEDTVVISNDPSSDPRAGGLPPGHPPLKSFLAIPFHYANRPTGLIGVANAVRGYSQADVDFLSPLVTTCGILAHSRHVADEQKRHQRLKEEAARTHGLVEFSQKLAHDLNNLLTVIQGTLEVQRLAKREGMSQEDVERLRIATKRASALAKRIVDFAGTRPINREPVSLPNVIKEATAICSPILPPHIEFTVVMNDALPPVFADVTLLQQAITNIIFNSIEAIGDRPGLIRITAKSPEKTHVILEIADDGPGMDDHTRGRAFEPYFSTKSGGDRGFGLASVLGFVHSHSAVLDCDSEPEQGTSIRIRLLAAASDPVEIHEDSEFSFEELTVLVVDDQEPVLNAVRNLLECVGTQVRTALSGAEGIAVLETAHLDLVVLDVTMPEMDGFETARRMRQIAPGLPVVFISGHANCAVPEEFTRDARMTFLAKPFSFDEIRDACELVIKGRDSRMEG